MPIIVIVGIALIWAASSTLPWVGAIVGIVIIVWFQRRADAYVRQRASSEDDD